VVKLLVVALLCAASVARAEPPELAKARAAIAAVDYGAAQRLLIEALHAGTSTTAELAEIYKLSARAAIVLGQPEVGEQYYRRWLSIDPRASLPDDTSPKLREPFVAAQAYLAAHGRLAARLDRTTDRDVIEVISDPLSMARTIIAGEARLAIGLDHRATLPAAAAHVTIVDEYGNHLVELDLPPRPTAVAAPATPPRAHGRDAPAVTPGRPWTRRWITWAIPTGVFGGIALGFGAAAIAESTNAREIADDSARHYYTEVGDSVHRARIFAGVSTAAGLAMIGLAIPTAILFLHERAERRTVVVPTGNGVAIVGRF
jgi:hypothetical protein